MSSFRTPSAAAAIPSHAMAADHVTIAISLLFGAIASLLISLLAVPLIYYMTHAGRLEQPA